MITKIILENFMSHSRTVIEPAPCLTVLTGPNNCGKSAVVAALQTICGNERGSFMVRHGQKESRVVVETAEGQAVEWRRRGGTVSYVVNGREVHRGVPEDLHEILCLPKVESREGKDEFDVHFGEQKRPIFLIGEPGSQAATFFASSSDAEYLVRMQSLHRQRTTERRAKERDLKQSISRLDRSLTALSPLEALGERMAGVERLYQACAAGMESANLLARDLEELRRLSTNYELSAGRYRCLEALAEPPEMAPVEALSRQAEEVRAASADVAAWGSHCAALEPMSQPPLQVDDARLESALIDLTASHRQLERAEVLHQTLEPLPIPPVQNPDGALEEDLYALSGARGQARLFSERAKALDALAPVPELAEEADLAGHLSELRNGTSAWEHAVGAWMAIERLPDPPLLRGEGELAAAVQAVRQGMSEHAAAHRRVKALDDLTEPPGPTDESLAAGVLFRLQSSQTAFEEATDALRQIREAAQAVKTEIEIWVALNPTCPVCGGDFDPRKILGEPEVAVG